MIDLRRPSPFIELAAVEAWDAWFRWREQADLRDLSIEDTWRRVSVALASVEAGGDIAVWQKRFMAALASWRLLPDECLLADAGTGRSPRGDGILHTTLNAAAFVSADRAAVPVFDLAALAEHAALAVRVLDNAALLAGMAAPHLRIGLLGIADALALLGLAYDSDTGRAQAAAMARALTEGCRRGSVALGLARGACGNAEPAAARAAPAKARQGVADRDVHHTRLTAITTQPRLALLANDVADAADPLRERNHAHVIVAAGGQRRLRSAGYALNILDARGDDVRDHADTLANLPWTAQMAMRAALQPWIDEPIDYPMLTTRVPDAAQQAEARRLAAAYGLGAPAWRNPAEPLPP